MPKKSLRRDLLAQRSNLDATAWQTASLQAQSRLIGLEVFRKAACIALYSPTRQEIDTNLLFLQASSTGKRILYPAVFNNTSLQFREVTELTQLAIGSFGILEPCRPGEGVAVTAADLIVVPGVAFDLQGCRIGFGKGYYDRSLRHLSAEVVLVGLCHDFQLLEAIPSEGHDIRMQYIVTDKRIIIPTGDESRNRPGAGLT